MDFYKVPVGFGLALSNNTAAMNRYALLNEAQKQKILNKARKCALRKGDVLPCGILFQRHNLKYRPAG